MDVKELKLYQAPEVKVVTITSQSILTGSGPGSGDTEDMTLKEGNF